MERATACTGVAVLCGLSAACSDPALRAAPAAVDSTGYAVVTVDATRRYQEMVGWEAGGTVGEHELVRFEPWAAQVIEEAAALGIDRLRLHVRSGMENSRDAWSDYAGGRLAYRQWRCLRYATVNDDADPHHIEASGFHFGGMDKSVEAVILPMKRALEARGRRLYVNATYVAFTGQICADGGYHHDRDPEEYAEFVLAVFEHLDRKYGLVPDAWEMILEPDKTRKWRGRGIGAALVATESRLRAAGYTPELIAPSTASMAQAVTYFDELAGVPGALAALDELSYHRYSGVSESALRALADRAATNGLRTAMLEHIGSGHENLYRDLTVGQASAWQQFYLGYPTKDNGAQYFVVDDSTEPPTVRQGERTRYLGQYFRHVRRGARRIAAETADPALHPTAFVGPDSGMVAIVWAERAARFAVAGLKPGPYRVTYTTATETASEAGIVDVAGGRLLEAAIPAAGVLTIHPAASTAASDSPS